MATNKSTLNPSPPTPAHPNEDPVAVGRKRKYTSCQHADAHRKAQNKYVKKNPAAQAKRVKQSETKNKAKVKARKQKQNAGKKPGSKTGGPKGAPRKC